MQPIGAHCCEVMCFGGFGFRGELVFLNCDDVCMCVVNKQRIGFGLHQSCGDRGSVGHGSVFWLRWCGWCRRGVGRGLGPGSGAVGWCYVCVRCESGFSV